MKNKNSLTVFDRIYTRKKRIIALVLVIVIVITTCFSNDPFLSKAEDDASDDTYFECIIKEMTKDVNRKFTILEIVPDKSCAEFIYFTGDQEIQNKLNWINENEKDTTIKRWYGTIGGSEGSPKAAGQYQLNADGFSNFKFTFNISRLSGKMYVEVENMFLNYVLPDYATFLEDRIEVNSKVANEVTVEDVNQADFIYVSMKPEDSSTFQINQFFSKYKSNGSDEYTVTAPEAVVKYNQVNGSFLGTTVTDVFSVPTYKDYEYVSNNSEKDTLLEESISSGKYITYPSSDGSGYYISRDMSWDVAQRIMEVSLEGKEFKNNEVRQVPIVFDGDDTTAASGNNIVRMQTIIRSVVTDVPTDESKIIKDTTATPETYTGYAIVKNMISTAYDVYNEYGVKTAVLNSEYYNDHTADSSVIVDGCSSDRKTGAAVTNSGGINVTTASWDNYLSYLYQDIQYGTANNIKLKLDIEGKFSNAVVVGELLNYKNNGVDVYASASTNFIIDSQSYTNRKPYLNPHFYAYNSDSRLISDNYDEKLTVKNASNLLGMADQTYTIIDILKYLLGVTSVKINTDPDSTLYANKYFKILEIEPSADFRFDTNEEMKQLATDMGLDATKLIYPGDANAVLNADGSYTVTNDKVMLDVDCYTTNALNGLNDSFIETYDIVYIGDNVGILNVDKNGKTQYRDTTLNGCLYTAYGDIVTVQSQLMGFLKSDFGGTYMKDGKTYRYVKNGGATARFSGNDLTVFKSEQLQKYAQAGNIVIVGDDLYDPTYTYATSNVRNIVASITENLSLEKTVFPYSKIEKAIYSYQDVNPVFESLTVTNTSDSSAIEKTLSYTNDTGVVTGVINTEGTGLNIKFHAKVTNVDADKKYKVYVYLDKNGDGIYNEVETHDDDNEVYKDITCTGAQLSNIDFDVPLNANFSGLLIWKVVVQEDETAKVIRSEQTGSVAIHAVDRDLKVLQIVPGKPEVDEDYDISTTLLMANSYVDASGTVKYVNRKDIQNDANYMRIYTTTPNLYTMTSDQISKNSSINDFEKLLWQTYHAIGYKINVTAVTTDKFNDGFYGNINEYDMVIVGFADVYGQADVSTDALAEITKYINSGKALLFSHDNVSFATLSRDEYVKKNGNGFVAAGDYWSPNISTSFRNLVGMNRYGVSNTEEDQVNGNDYVPFVDSTKKLSEIQGLSIDTLMRYSSAKTFPYVGGMQVSGTASTRTVSKLNDGQVTQYPFQISDSISVAETHPQYFQLDLEVPKNDEGAHLENEKVMVWYTLGGTGKYFTDTFKDAANNYYIYSKGNITYTGAGHRPMLNDSGKATSSAELKLFVNTIVKAITAGNFVPVITVSNAQYSSGIYNIYVNDYSDENSYQIKFAASDADLVPNSGMFKNASLVWVDNSNVEHTLIDYGSTLKCEEQQIVVIKDFELGNAEKKIASIGSDYAALISEIQAGTADFVIKVEDSRGAETQANVSFQLRKLFEMD